MKITRKDKEELTAQLTVELELSDFEKEYNSELNKRQKTAALKGFRKGKTPMSFVKKVYANEILSKLIDDKVMKSLYKHIEDEQILMIGAPMPSEDHKAIDVDYKSVANYEFNFDIGYAPDFEVKGGQSTDSYTKFLPAVPKERVDEEMTRMRRMFGTREKVDGAFEDGDSIMIHGFEQDGGKAKVAGKEVSFTVLAEDISEDYKAAFMKSKVGDKVKFDIYKLEKDRTKEFVDKYFVKLEEGEEVNNEFEAEIMEVTRVKEADLTKEVLQKVFREKPVETEEEARKEIESQISGHYKADATNLMYRGIMDNMMEQNNFDLPNKFIDRWLFQGKEEMEAEEKEKQLSEAMKEIKWSVIRNKLSKSFAVKVEEQDILRRVQEKASQMARQYGMGAEHVQEISKMILQNEREMKQVYLELESEKMFVELAQHVKVEEKEVTFEEFEKERDKVLKKD